MTLFFRRIAGVLSRHNAVPCNFDPFFCSVFLSPGHDSASLIDHSVLFHCPLLKDRVGNRVRFPPVIDFLPAAARSPSCPPPQAEVSIILYLDHSRATATRQPQNGPKRRPAAKKIYTSPAKSGRICCAVLKGFRRTAFALQIHAPSNVKSYLQTAEHDYFS